MKELNENQLLELKHIAEIKKLDVEDLVIYYHDLDEEPERVRAEFDGFNIWLYKRVKELE